MATVIVQAVMGEEESTVERICEVGGFYAGSERVNDGG